MIQPYSTPTTSLYANYIALSKRVHWEVDKDVFKDHELDFNNKILPHGLAKVRDLEFMPGSDKKLTDSEHDTATQDLIDLIVAIDGIL